MAKKRSAKSTANASAGREPAPAEYKLPPARGRTGFELRADHRLTYVGIGPTDAPSRADGRWDLEEGEAPAIRIELESGEVQRLPIVSAEPDRLVLGK